MARFNLFLNCMKILLKFIFLCFSQAMPSMNEFQRKKVSILCCRLDSILFSLILIISVGFYYFFWFFFSNEIISLNKLNASESIEIVRRAFYFDSEKIWKIYEQNKNHILHDVHEHKSLWQLKCASSLMYSIFIYFVRYCFRLPPSYIHIYGIYILFGVFTVHSQSQYVALSNLLKLLEIHNCLKQTRASEENY